MEGVSFVLRKNCDDIISKGTAIDSIIATGGGAKSAIWCQMQADITGLPVSIPKEKEAACLGAALIGAVSDGRFESYSQAVHACMQLTHTYEPHPTDRLERKYRRFNALYNAALEIGKI